MELEADVFEEGGNLGDPQIGQALQCQAQDRLAVAHILVVAAHGQVGGAIYAVLEEQGIYGGQHFLCHVREGVDSGFAGLGDPVPPRPPAREAHYAPQK
jgi:hypothetical protein